MLKKAFALGLIIVLFNILPVSLVSVANFTDTNHWVSDDDFFGVWNDTESKWDIEGKLDYNYAPGLKYVEDYVKAGDLPNAREALLHYYKNRPPELKFDATVGRDAPMARTFGEGKIWSSETSPIDIFQINSIPDWYSLDVSAHVVNNSVPAYILHPLKRDLGEEGAEKIVRFNSKESGVNAPYLEVTQAGITTRVDIESDMYLRGGDFAGVSYGTSDYIEVSDWWESGKPLYINDTAYNTGASNNKYEQLPMSNGTRQGYLKFNLTMGFDPSIPFDRVVLHLYGSSPDEHNKEVVLFKTNDNFWTDTSRSRLSEFPVRVFSYDGIPGEYGWLKPEGAHDQCYNVWNRNLYLSSLFQETRATGNQFYAKRGIEIFLDYINDVCGLSHDWYHFESRLNAGFRGDPYSFQMIFGAIDSAVIDANAFMSIIKYCWMEPDAMTSPLMDGQINTNAVSAAINTLLRYCIYFPEFNDNSGWLQILYKRLDEVNKEYFFDDGGYREPTSGYGHLVLRNFNTMYDMAKRAGITLSDEFINAYRRYTYISMLHARPDKIEYNWGDGSAANIYSTILKTGENLDYPEAVWFGTDGAKGQMPSETDIVLPITQMGAMRNNWTPEAIQMFFIARVGGSHAHRHANSVQMSAYGRLFLTDTGMGSYDTSHPLYQWQAVGTESHNTVEVNGMPQTTLGKEDMPTLSSIDMAFNSMAGYYTGVSQGYLTVLHTRRVAFIKNPGFFIVTDFMEPQNKTATNTYAQSWHMPTNAAPSYDGTACYVKTNYSSGANLSIIPISPNSYTSIGLKNNPMGTKHASFVTQLAGDQTFSTLLYPFENAAENIVVQDIPVFGGQAGDAAAYSLKLPSGADAVYYTSNDLDETRRFSRYEVNADALYIENMPRSSAVQLLSGYNMRSVSQNGEPLLESSVVLPEISVRYSGNTVYVETKTAFGQLALYAPQNVNRLILNGFEIAFVRSGDKVTFELDGSSISAPPETGIRPPSGGHIIGGGTGTSPIIPSPMPSPEPTPTPPDSETPVFNDLDKHWAQIEVEDMALLGIINGENNLFYPDRALSRAEAAAIAARVLKPQVPEKNSGYSDVSPEEWYAKSVYTLTEAGVLSGKGNSLFDPYGTVTRAELSKIMLEIYDRLTGKPTDEADKLFDDAYEFPEWAVGYIQKAVTLGFVNGFPNNTFKPNNSVTRAEAAVMFKRLLDKAVSEYEQTGNPD